MRPAVARRPWRTTLVAGALLAVGVGLVVGFWFKPAATTQSASVTIPAAPSAEQAGPAPAPVRAVADEVAAPPSTQTAQTAPTIQPIPPVKPGDPVTPADPSDPSDLSRLRGRSLTLPVSGVSAAQLSDTFAQSRAAGTPHEAIDIMAPRGTPVLAVEDGRVAKLFLSKPGGITLYQFDPAGEFAYYYAHLDRYAEGITEGASVRKGQLIGYVGSTGNASPEAPHLHFAIFRLGPERQWWRGTPLNPFLVWRDARP